MSNFTGGSHIQTKAYILIETAVGTSRDAADALRSLQGVQTLDAVTGPYDIIAVVGAPDRLRDQFLVEPNLHIFIDHF